MLCETLKTRWTFLAFKGSAPWGVKPASQSLSHNVHHVTHTLTHNTLINKINLSLALHPPLQSSFPIIFLTCAACCDLHQTEVSMRSDDKLSTMYLPTYQVPRHGHHHPQQPPMLADSDLFLQMLKTWFVKSQSEKSEIMLTRWVSSDSVNADHVRCARAGVVDGGVPAENLYSLKSFVECCHTNNCNHT